MICIGKFVVYIERNKDTVLCTNMYQKKCFLKAEDYS